MIINFLVLFRRFLIFFLSFFFFLLIMAPRIAMNMNYPFPVRLPGRDPSSGAPEAQVNARLAFVLAVTFASFTVNFLAA